MLPAADRIGSAPTFFMSMPYRIVMPSDRLDSARSVEIDRIILVAHHYFRLSQLQGVRKANSLSGEATNGTETSAFGQPVATRQESARLAVIESSRSCMPP